jgi:hypothetical protein
VYSGNVWGIINSFNSIDVLAELDGNKLHSLSNGLTLRLEVHSLFDDLDLWFEEVQVSNITESFSHSPLNGISHRVSQILIPSVPWTQITISLLPFPTHAKSLSPQLLVWSFRTRDTSSYMLSSVELLTCRVLLTI